MKHRVESLSAIVGATVMAMVAAGGPAAGQGFEGTTRQAVEAQMEARGARYIELRDAGLRFIREADGFGRYLANAASEEREPAYLTADGVMLNPPEHNLVDLGASFLASRDAENWNRLYRLVHPRLPEELRANVPPIARFVRFDLQRKTRVWTRISTWLERNPGEWRGSPGGAGGIGPIIADCTKEAGYESAGTDSEISDRCKNADFAPLGILANINFPLRDNLTCVKDQSRRGTCVAHAAAATVESLRSVISGEKKNLSEQDMYFEAESNSGSGTDMFVDGLNTAIALEYFDTANYDIQYENEWNYVRATGRGSPAEATHPANLVTYYPGQCSGSYTGEMCTEYASSGEHDFLFPGVPTTARRPSVPSNGAEEIIDALLLPLEPALLWPLQEPIIQMLLADDLPAIVTSSITDDFSNYDTNGYVKYTGSTTKGGEKPGNHAMELVGYVANAELPAGAPSATGHGYYVVKNSWGINKADCGFYYVDSEYFRNRATLVAFLTIRN